MKWHCSILVLFPLMLIGFAATAQDQAGRDTSGMSAISVSEVLDELNTDNTTNLRVSSASKVAQKTSEAPSIISVVNQRQIQQFGWISPNNVLTRMPGFAASQDYERRTVSSRGFYEGWNNSHLLMLVDGVPINDNIYGTAFTSEITPLMFTRSIEILRGPGAALYGSNATNGVVAINTISASDLNGAAEVRLRGGNGGMRMIDVLSGGRNDYVSFLSSFNAYETHGNHYLSYDGSGRTDAQGNLMKFETNDKHANFYLFNKLEGRGKMAGFSLQHHEQVWNYETGHGWLYHVPDLPEQMREIRRQIIFKYTTPNPARKLTQEYVIRYQHHDIDWNLRLYPDSTQADGIFYPQGMWEYVETNGEDMFTRLQWGYKFTNTGLLLGGVENTMFWYGGDHRHLSNVDLTHTFAPFPGNALRPLRPWLEWGDGNPVLTSGVYLQYISPNWLNGKLKATLGLRYDRQAFRFNALDKPQGGKEKKSHSQFNPRLSLVYFLSKNITIKGIAGRAFRTPSPSELFGANTYTLGSNPRHLLPENISTYELAAEGNITENLQWTINGFYTEFDNEIAYSTQNANLSTNVYSLTNAGMETELQFTGKTLSGFLNYSFTRRLNEEILDSAIATSRTRLTWYPQHLANLGLTYRLKKKWYTSVQLHYQGKVNRRSSDRTELYDRLRGEAVKSWVGTDLKLGYTLSRKAELGLVVTNLFDQTRYLVKTGDYPFDYRMEGRRIWIDLKVSF